MARRRYAYLLLLLALVAADAAGQRVRNKKLIGGFLGMKWGEEKARIIDQMKTREGVVFDSSQSRKNFLFFHGGELNGREIDTWQIEMIDDKLLKISMLYDVEREKVCPLFRELRKELKETFGSMGTDRSSHGGSDEAMLQAVAARRFLPLVAWFIPNESDTREIVSISIDEELVVVLTYASTFAR